LNYILIFAFLLLASAISGIIYLAARNSTLEPKFSPVYNDLNRNGKVMFSHKLKISGKPDMILKKGITLVPMEYKSTKSDTPRTGHIMQMAAYFAILEENFPGMQISYGILEYSSRKFKIKNTSELRTRLIMILNEMRNVSEIPRRNHNNAGRCFKCSFSESCLQNLITAKR
jgi:CRISPR-associated exonuclease Cas4